MQGRLIKFQGHIRTEKYNLNYINEVELRKRCERYINPQYVVSIEQLIDQAFDRQDMFYISAKEYCKVWTVHGVFEVDGTLEQVAEQVYHGKGIEYPVR
jgi:hypothetical protein